MRPPIYEEPIDWTYNCNTTNNRELTYNNRSTQRKFPVYYSLLFIVVCLLIIIIGYTIIYLTCCSNINKPGYNSPDPTTFEKINRREERNPRSNHPNTWTPRGGETGNRRSNCQVESVPSPPQP